MGLGQTMITAAFLVLLSVAILSANRMVVQSDETVNTADAYGQAAILAEALLAELALKKYDERENKTVYQSTSNFTAPSSLGPDVGETISPLPDAAPFQSLALFDDVDDYHNYSRVVNLAHMPGFVISTSVYYVSATDLSTRVRWRTYFKRADVSVQHPVYLKQKITFSTLLTY